MSIEKEALAVRKKELDDLREVASTEVGRRFLWRFISECGVYQDVSGSSEYVYRKLGQRSVGLKLMIDIEEADPTIQLKMIQENINREKERQHDDSQRNSRLLQRTDEDKYGHGYENTGTHQY